jgi:hypothetical protein
MMSPRQEVVHVAVASAHLASNIVHRLHIHAPAEKAIRIDESALSQANLAKQHLYLPTFNGL